MISADILNDQFPECFSTKIYFFSVKKYFYPQVDFCHPKLWDWISANWRNLGSIPTFNKCISSTISECNIKNEVISIETINPYLIHILGLNFSGELALLFSSDCYHNVTRCAFRWYMDCLKLHKFHNYKLAYVKRITFLEGNKII